MRSLIICLLTLFIFACNEDNSTEPNENNTDTTVVVRKPNLYMYPKEEINLSVKIKFPLGGVLLESDPEYENGWSICVRPDGLINDEYRYLFYEYEVPDLHQQDFGWLVQKEDMKEFFQKNMETAGFLSAEINDFIEYWIPEFTGYPYYAVYPQLQNTLDVMTEIEFSVEPDHFFRLQYLIRGIYNNDMDIK